MSGNTREFLSPTTYLNGRVGPIKRLSYPVGLMTDVARALPVISNPATRAEISWEIDRYWVKRRSPNALKTLSVLQFLLQSVAPLYPAIKTPGEIILGKQQPSFLESIEETLKRLRFLAQYVPALPTSILSCISGGSMSYGRFFNVRSGEDPSDLDLIIVYEDGKTENLSAKELLPTHLGFQLKDQELLTERLKVYQELEKKGQAEVMSQKSAVPTSGFDVSMHIMARNTFNNMILFDPIADAKLGRNVDRRLLDYKPNPFKHQKMIQRDFHGDPHEFLADETSVASGVSSNEVVSRIPAYAIKEGVYVPGMYSNLLSPRFEHEPLTDTRVSAAVTMYWAFMQDIAKASRRMNPQASVLKSHIRYPIFSSKLKAQYE